MISVFLRRRKRSRVNSKEEDIMSIIRYNGFFEENEKIVCEQNGRQHFYNPTVILDGEGGIVLLNDGVSLKTSIEAIVYYSKKIGVDVSSLLDISKKYQIIFQEEEDFSFAYDVLKEYLPDDWDKISKQRAELEKMRKEVKKILLDNHIVVKVNC